MPWPVKCGCSLPGWLVPVFFHNFFRGLPSRAGLFRGGLSVRRGPGSVSTAERGFCRFRHVQLGGGRRALLSFYALFRFALYGRDYFSLLVTGYPQSGALLVLPEDHRSLKPAATEDLPSGLTVAQFMAGRKPGVQGKLGEEKRR